MKHTNKISVLFVLALIVYGMAFINPVSVSAAKKVSLSKKLTVRVGQSKKLKLKNNKKKVTWKVISGKKNITLKSKKKTEITVIGRKKGTAKVQAKIGKKKYTCKVTVKSNIVNGVLQLHYNGKNLDEVMEQVQNSKRPVHVIVDKGVTKIGKQAFRFPKNVKSVTIPNSVTNIGEGAFWDSEGLTSITIPASVTHIGDYAFAGCGGLTRITVVKKNRTYNSRGNCNAIIKTKTNTLIAGCKNTKIPDNVTSIAIGAFEGCYGLTNITIPDKVTSIGNSAFRYCNRLTSITIPANVKSIEAWAFSGCGLTSITIPASVTSIEKTAFIGDFTKITVARENRKYDSRDNCNAIIETSTNTLIAGCKNTTIPDSVTSIGDWAFWGCDITNITIPASVKSIGKEAFTYCNKLTNIKWNGKTYTSVDKFLAVFNSNKK